MNFRILYCLFPALLCAISASGQALYGQPSAAPMSVFTYLTPEENPTWTLEFNWTDLLANRRKCRYYPAVLTDHTGRNYPVQVKARGKFRLKTCEIPPLQVKFLQPNLREYGLDTLDEIDISLPCMEEPKGAELLMREYIAYRMYERLTPEAIRARLIRLTIRDVHDGGRPKQMLAMAVEDEEEMAARLNGQSLEEYGMAPERLDMAYAARMVIYQYMIGNTDWDISMFRNIQLIQPREAGRKVLTIPYDFDFSGFVSAPYATPNSLFGLRHVRDRFLMANGIDPTAFSNAIQDLKNARPAFVELCTTPLLAKKTSAQLIRYLDTFFKVVEQENSVPEKMTVSKL